MLLNGDTLVTGSKREKLTAISTQESELVAVYRGLRDLMGALWVLRSLKLKVERAACTGHQHTLRHSGEAITACRMRTAPKPHSPST